MEQNIETVNKAEPKKLTVFQSAAIINGCGIGAGIVAIPYFANKVGIWLAILIVVLSYLGVFVIHLLIAELTIRSGPGSSMIDVLNKSNAFKKVKKVLPIIVFILVSIILTSDLCSYIMAASQLFSANIPGVPIWVWKIVFYLFAAIVALFGLKVLGVCEKYATILIFALVGSLIFASFFHLDAKVNQLPESFKDVLVYTSMSMFAFNAFFSVPQVVEGLQGDKKQIRKSINIGMLFNMGVILLIMIFCLLSSKTITNPCIIGWAENIGKWAVIVGIIFVTLALLSSYWAFSFSLRDLIAGQLKINEKLCWLIATLPSLIFAIVISFIDESGAGFDLFISISSVFEAILIGIFMIPSFHSLRKETIKGESIFGKFGMVLPEIIAYICIGLIAAGGILNIIQKFV